jgi:quinol monooxygenase YgiN
MENTTQIVTLRVQIQPNQRKIVLDAARMYIGPTQVQPGCISCRFYQDVVNPDAILFVEKWKSRKALDEHLRSDRYRVILSFIDMSTEKPDFKIHTISKIEGIESIELVRMPA